MNSSNRLFSSKTVGSIVFTFLLVILLQARVWAQQQQLCLDGFCIGQTIQDAHFDAVAWVKPRKNMSNEECAGVGCQPENAFRGYPKEDQEGLTTALSMRYSLRYNLITRETLDILRKYHYECNPSPGGIFGGKGQRRFIGIYLSIPSNYPTIVGLRLINGELTIYRIARQIPFHNQGELTSLAKEIKHQYGPRILLYDGISSNAPYDVIKQGKDGWFGRSTMFNPSDLSDLDAELVLIDPVTRVLLQPTSMPDSGEISPLPVRLPAPCGRSIPIQ